MNHRERRNFRGKKNKNRTFGSSHPRWNFHVQLHELPHPQSSGHPCCEAVPQCPSCFGSRTRLEQIEKISSPGHQHWTWPDHPMGTETGRWQKQKFKQKRQAVSRQLQPFSELGRHPIWKRHGTLVGSGFLAWLRGVHGVEPVELLTFWTLGDSWWILGALGEAPPNSSQNCVSSVCRIITQPPAGRECPAVTSESPQHRKTFFTSIHC